MVKLNDNKRNTFSQGGEDGILESLFLHLGIHIGWFVEFGASDGVSLSNTRCLLYKGWRGIYIEADEKKMFTLRLNTIDYYNRNQVYIVNKKVTRERNDTNINSILSSTPIPKDFDLISIDVDGNDYWIWKALEYDPKVVVIEYNPSFKQDIPLSVKYNRNLSWQGTDYYGATSSALINLGKKKGYSLVAFTEGLNLIFVKNELAGQFEKVNQSEIKMKRFFPHDKRRMVRV
jgi:hypothetical protein